MIFKVYYLVVVTVYASISDITCTPTPSEAFPHHTELTPGDKYHLFWKYDDKLVTFEVHVRTKGYVGLGFSPNGNMKGADIALGWVKDGKAYLKDFHATGNTRPVLDKHQDWELLFGKENARYTVLKFRRVLKTCDQANDNEITGGTMRLIWAFHQEDPMSEKYGHLKWHGRNRGAKSIYLLGKSRENQSLPQDAFFIDILNKNVTIPQSKTTYWCKAFSAKQLGLKKKHHIVKIEAMIQSGMESVVHHILFYFCDKPFDSSIHGLSYNCFNRDKGHPAIYDLMQCQGVLFGWGVGGQAADLPDNVGLPIGGPDDNDVYRLETHYDNVLMEPGMVDSSGIRIWVTPTRRKYDGATMQTGIVVSQEQIIPPAFPLLDNYGHCIKECLANGLLNQPAGITVFAAIVHAHLAGIRMKIHHYRSGTELEPILEDSSYDFNFQDFRLLEKPRKILPGDSLMVQCTYKSTDRNSTTFGGLSTEDEMCLGLIMYYPKIPLTVCASVPTFSQTVKFIGGEVDSGWPPKMSKPAKYAGDSLKEVMDKMYWSNEMQSSFQKGINTGQIRILCKESTTTLWLSNGQIVPVPKIRNVWNRPHTPCVTVNLSQPSVAAATVAVTAKVTPIYTTNSTQPSVATTPYSSQRTSPVIVAFIFCSIFLNVLC